MTLFLGVDGGQSSTTALIAALQPLLVMTVAGRVLGESTNRAAWIGTALGFVGVFVVVSTEMRADHAPTWVYIFPSLAMLSLTVGTILSKKMNPPETLLQTITMQAVVSAVTFALVATLTGQAHVPINVDAWAAIAWLILIPSIAGYGLYVYVTHASGATAVSTLLYLTPPTTMLWAHLMFGDPIYLTALLGLGISALGVFLVLRAKNATMSRK